MNIRVKLPVIAGVEITTDAEGRFNLNALHRASGLGANKAPAQWLRTQAAQDLVAELERGDVQNCISASKGGTGVQGTFAHELLAISYAGWISPAFQLQVNRVFLDYRTGSLAPAIPAETLEQIERSFGIMRMVAHKVTEMEKALPGIVTSLVQPLVAARLAESALLLRHGKTAKQIWDAAGLPPKIRGSAVWFGNRLKEGGCLLEGRADRGDGAIRLFDPDKAGTLLSLGLRYRAKTYADERKGQGRLMLVPS
ncbi:KilA-N domain-containing protein [Pseudogemmobacter sonorensis]|uniref:KilA-N domain-containing protein n=1 Tax=Pseudogemmobacter sonorensis TaxID=2989681 RepID=UPI0036BCA057